MVKNNNYNNLIEISILLFNLLISRGTYMIGGKSTVLSRYFKCLDIFFTHKHIVIMGPNSNKLLSCIVKICK